jgi:hypothetical protein
MPYLNVGLTSWATLLLAIILASALLYPVGLRIRRRARSDRFGGIKELTNPEDAKFQYESLRSH